MAVHELEVMVHDATGNTLVPTATAMLLLLLLLQDLTSAGLAVTGTFGVVLIHSMVVFLMVRRSVRLQQSSDSRTAATASNTQIITTAAFTKLAVQLLESGSVAQLHGGMDQHKHPQTSQPSYLVNHANLASMLHLYQYQALPENK
jgi:hypothetical protein